MDRERIVSRYAVAQVSSSWAVASSVTIGLLALTAYGLFTSKFLIKSAVSHKSDALSADPGLLKKNTTYERYETSSGRVYPRIRTFYSSNPQAKKLPNDLPLLVFMHGLGGSAAQFAPLLTSLVNVAPCLAIDLPGCGLSDFQSSELEAYTTVAFAELLAAAIDRFRDKSNDQKAILIGHSMGATICALLASSTSPLAPTCTKTISGVVAICPRSTPLSEKDLSAIQRLNWIPSFLFDLIRLADRRGGVESVSVLRVTGKDADLETRKLQLRFNQQSKSAVFQKFCLAMRLQELTVAAAGQQSLWGERVWSGIKIPLFLVAAENDKMALPREIEQISSWLTRQTKPQVSTEDKEVAPEVQPHGPVTGQEPHVPALPTSAGDAELATEQLASFKGFQTPSDHAQGSVVLEQNHRTKNATALKTTIFPAPSSHSLLYATADVRILSGLIENFLAKHVDKRLSPGWQLQHLTTSGKWDVKNLGKWKAIDPCSELIGGVFRALKTMREVDADHCPREFVKKFGWQAIPNGVAMVVDISHESPVYDKNGLEEGGIEYHKFPTVSKLPPSADEVEHFIDLIDGLRRSSKLQQRHDGAAAVGVHCHYGFNRTGFFIVCYLVERLGYKLQDAVAEFAQKRAPGIKHEYFVNELFVRYAVKMERRGTIVR